MKLLIDGEYRSVGIMSFLKCMAISQLTLLLIIVIAVFAAAGISSIL